MKTQRAFKAAWPTRQSNQGDPRKSPVLISPQGHLVFPVVVTPIEMTTQVGQVDVVVWQVQLQPNGLVQIPGEHFVAQRRHAWQGMTELIKMQSIQGVAERQLPTISPVKLIGFFVDFQINGFR